jgi:hypothetical protein
LKSDGAALEEGLIRNDFHPSGNYAAGAKKAAASSAEN